MRKPTLETIIKNEVKSELLKRFNKLRNHNDPKGELKKLVEPLLIQEGVVAIRMHTRVFKFAP